MKKITKKSLALFALLMLVVPFSAGTGFVSAASSTITAWPNPCVIARGRTTCDSTIYWQAPSNPNACVYVMGATKIYSLLGCKGTGIAAVSWITETGATFDLRASRSPTAQLLGSVTVKGTKSTSSQFISAPTLSGLAVAGQPVTITWTSTGIAKIMAIWERVTPDGMQQDRSAPNYTGWITKPEIAVNSGHEVLNTNSTVWNIPANLTSGTYDIQIFNFDQNVPGAGGTFGSLPIGKSATFSIAGPAINPKGLVSFTFDDGWASAYQNGIPILNAAGIKSTQYIITSALGDTADGYITKSQMLAMQNQGHEIESHTKTHPDLTKISATQAKDEIAGSKSLLESMGIAPITSFDYPYGNWNSSVENIVKTSGYAAARTVDGGFNDKTSDLFALKSNAVERGGTCDGGAPVTALSTVQGWVDTAMNTNTWLILDFHQIDNITANCYGITPSLLQSIVNYIKQKNVKTVTVSQGLQLIKQ